ncbi:hypothetical protein ACFOW1_01730 [Parasediminibacterium paludis]|uniref:Uncharacterized protein n=1 Tax=Parasediminibacterium paludis TaxID=908966 RepID=A0ABV8PRF8_9BACT
MNAYQESLQNAINNCENYIQESFSQNVFLGQSIVLLIQKVKRDIAKEQNEQKYLDELNKAILDLEKTKQLYQEKEDTIGIVETTTSIKTLELCKQNFNELIIYSHVKEGDYISARLDKACAIVGLRICARKV